MRRSPVFIFAIIWLSILCAAFLQVMPLPPWADHYLRPHWMLLTVMYWTLALPHRFGIFSAFVTGLMLDVFWGSTLGFNGLAFGLCSAFITQQCQKIRSYSVWHQALIFTAVVAIYQWLFAMISLWADNALIPHGYYITSLISLAAWPWIFFTLRKVRRRFFLY